MNLLLLIVGLLLLVLIDVPIGVALGAIAVVAMVASEGARDLPNIGLVLFDGATKFPLIAIPLFILAGAVMNSSGISQRLIALATAIFGCVRGGLSMVTIGASLFFAEICGSAVAGVAALGSVLIPAMERRGYPTELAAAVTSSASTLAVFIPPSIPLILYGVMANTSVVELFVAGILPGVLGGILLMAIAYWTAVRRNYPIEEVFQLSNLWRRLKEAGWALLLPVIVLGGIFSGFVTATEGAGLAVAAAVFIGVFIYREMDRKKLWEAMVQGGIQTAVVMLLVATSALLGEYLTSIQAPQTIARGIIDLTDDRYLVLALLNIFFLVIGLFLHSAAAIILIVPIVMPLVNAVGIDPVHFGIIVTLNLGIGQQTPPVASVLVTACSIAKADIWEVTKVNLPFIGALTVVLLLVTYIPSIALVLVDLFYR